MHAQWLFSANSLKTLVCISDLRNFTIGELMSWLANVIVALRLARHILLVSNTELKLTVTERVRNYMFLFCFAPAKLWSIRRHSVSSFGL